MGCGASSAARASSPTAKDADDLFLEPIDFPRFGIQEWDDFLDGVEAPVNTISEIANDINGVIDDIKDAAAAALGAYRVDIDMNIPETDKILLKLLKTADGTFPAPEEVAKLDAKATDADVKLQKAVTALYAAGASKLKVENDVLVTVGAPPEAAAFNAALTELRDAVSAAGLKVTLAVKAAGVPGYKGVRARIIKPVFKGDSADYIEEPVTLLAFAKTKQAAAIAAAEAAVADATAALNKALKETPTSAYTIKPMKKRVLVTLKAAKPSGGGGGGGGDGGDGGAGGGDGGDGGGPVAEGDEDEGGAAGGGGGGDAGGDAGGGDAGGGDAGGDAGGDGGDKEGGSGGGGGGAKGGMFKDPNEEKKKKLKAAATAFNNTTFKLAKACMNINGDVSMARAVTLLFEAIIDKAKKAAPNATAGSLANIVKFKPKIAMVDGSLDFDYDFGLNLPEMKVDSLEDAMKLMPGKVQYVYKTVFSIKDRIKEMMPKFTELKDQILEIPDKATAAFESPMDKIKEKFGSNLSPMEVIKFGKNVMDVVMKVKDTVKVASVMVDTISRVKGELEKSVTDVQKLLA